MTDPIAPNTEATPASAPAATPTPAPEEYHPSQDDAKGLEAYRAAKQARAAAPEDKPDAPALPAPEPEPTTPPPVPEAEDEKIARIWGRISGLEKERDAQKGEIESLRAKAARADALEAKIKGFHDDPEALFSEVAWDADKIRDYITHGKAAPSIETQRVAKETADVRRELTELRMQLQQRDEAAAVEQAKGRILDQIKPEAPSLPYLHAYYDQPAEMANAIWQVISATYQQQKTVLSVPEAAKVVEKVLSEQAQRFSRARSQSPGSSTAPAAKPVSPTLTNTPAGSSTSKKSPEDSSDEENLAAAVQMLKAARGQ
jgi:hypothetical protein